MIRNRWYAIAESRELRRGRPLGLKRLGERLVLWRTSDGAVGCAADQCPHRGAALGAGRVVGEHVQCPFHGLEFDASGRCRDIPANGRGGEVDRRFDTSSYPAREAHGFLWIWWGEARDELPPLPFFEDLTDGFLWSSFVDHWPVHYSRAIENQLDVAHLPFVHDTTIGRGNKTLVDGPGVEVEGDDIHFWVRNRADGPPPPLASGELGREQAAVTLTFRFPHLWQNRISDKVRVFVAFVPVDEHNSVLYMRFYQRFLRVPLLGQFIAWLGMLFSIVILRQDKRVVVTQRPVESALRMDEQLFAADLPIVKYRMGRDRLLGGQPTAGGSQEVKG